MPVQMIGGIAGFFATHPDDITVCHRHGRFKGSMQPVTHADDFSDCPFCNGGYLNFILLRRLGGSASLSPSFPSKSL